MKTDTQTHPKVVTISFFRNSAKSLGEFFERRDRLTYPKDRIHHIWIEGDSDDDTYNILRADAARRPNTVVRKQDFNCPQIRAFVHPGRLAKLSASANFSIRTLLKESDAEYVLWIESDLDYPPDIIERLLRCDKDIVAPMILIHGTKNFYDTFAFRKGNDPRLRGPGGEAGCFQANHPYHPAYREDAPFEVDAAGSCFLFRMEVIRKGAYFREDAAIVGFCQTAKERGFQTWVDPSTVIWHPVPEHVLDWKEWQPWEEAKVLMKYQEKVPIDQAAFGLGQPFGFARPLEFGWIAKRIHRDRGAKTLDSSVEISTFPAYCAALGLDVVATGPESLEGMHNEMMEQSGVRYRFVAPDGPKLSFENGHFDQVIAIGSLAFNQADREAAQELGRLCKPKGKIFVTLPYDHVGFWWDRCAGGTPGRYYYDLQAALDRIVGPMQATIKDLNFIRYELPKKNQDPIFTHPANSGVIALELEKKA